MAKTKFILKEHVDGYKITELAKHMDMTYTQIYKYLNDDANPTLAMLDRFAEGLSKLKNKKISVLDLLEINGKRYKT